MSIARTIPNLVRLIVLFFVALGLFILATTTVFSQDASPAASPGAGTAEFAFPIEDLGGCTDLATCTSYCEDPVNQNSCSDFAKKNGFYKDDQTQYADDEFWTDAQNELGCNSTDSCSTFCTDPANHESCDAFAKRNEIPGGYTDTPDKPEYLAIAQNTLGCDSAESCSTFCDDSANAQACTDFANQVGLEGGTTNEGPGGCQTPQTCSAYCSDPANFSQCANPGQGGNTGFAGPGGCSDEASCRSYCDQNSESCRSYAPGSSGVYVPISCPAGEYHGPGGVCTATANTQEAANCVGSDKYWDGSSCQDQAPVGIDPEVPSAHFEGRSEMGNCGTLRECFDWCKENSDKCPGVLIGDAIVPPTDEYDPYIYYTPGSEVAYDPIESLGGCTSPAGCYDYCAANPASCPGFNNDTPRPPEIYIPETYFTPPTDTVYVTPPDTFFYTTPIYPTPPEGSTYTTPQYYTPGTYPTPSYTTPSDPAYTTPNYYTPGGNYPTPTGEYPTPNYPTPTYYTPPRGTDYSTPYYYTPPQYATPYYYTPSGNYTTPTYNTPPVYATPQYYTPWTGVGYTTPTYYTPISYNTPYYPTPPTGTNYTTPNYYTPPINYTTPRYYTPWQYPTPIQYTTPNYPTPTYSSPPSWWANYPTPNYPTPREYPSPPFYGTPVITYSSPPYTPYTTPNYPTPPEGSPYTSPPYYSPGGCPGGVCYSSPPYYSPGGCTGGSCPYPTPQYVYPSPSGTGVPYYTPNSSYTYPSPTDGYSTPSPNNPYSTPPGDGSGSYYVTPSYGTPSYGTPSYDTPSYNSPPEYASPYATPVQGAQTVRTIFDYILGLFK